MRLGERDVEILKAVAEMRCLSTSQLAALFFTSTKKASQRLKQLTDDGVLVAERREWVFACPKVEFFYRLSLATLRRFAADSGPQSPKGAPPRNLKHLAAINQFAISLRKEVPTVRGLSHRFIPSWSLCSTADGRSDAEASGRREKLMAAAVKPDGACVLHRGAQSLLFFVEIDLSTEPITRNSHDDQVSLCGKIGQYCAYFDSDDYLHDARRVFGAEVRGFRVLLVTTTTDRLDTLRGGLGSFGDTRFVWATTFTRVEEDGVLGQTWQVMSERDTATHSICQPYAHPLASIPAGKPS